MALASRSNDIYPAIRMEDPITGLSSPGHLPGQLQVLRATSIADRRSVEIVATYGGKICNGASDRGIVVPRQRQFMRRRSSKPREIHRVLPARKGVHCHAGDNGGQCPSGRRQRLALVGLPGTCRRSSRPPPARRRPGGRCRGQRILAMPMVSTSDISTINCLQRLQAGLDNGNHLRQSRIVARHLLQRCCRHANADSSRLHMPNRPHKCH